MGEFGRNQLHLLRALFICTHSDTGRYTLKFSQRKLSSPVETVRTFFPETWIWELSEVGYVNGITAHSRMPSRVFKMKLNITKILLTTFYCTVLHDRDSGSAQVPVTVPDTITSWETEAFCLSSEGLGLAPPAQLTVFQPFFLELSLPYSIIRGEIFELKATVFNYLSKCIMVRFHTQSYQIISNMPLIMCG